MAEFLIYDGDHWMNYLSEEQIAGYVKKYPNFMDKYNSRYRKGDIIEVRPDGHYTGAKARNFRKDKFSIVSIPGMKVEDAKQYNKRSYAEAGTDAKGNQMYSVVRKSRYNIKNVVAKGEIVTMNLSSLNVEDKELTIG